MYSRTMMPLLVVTAPSVVVEHDARQSRDPRRQGGDFVAWQPGDDRASFVIGDVAAKGKIGTDLAQRLRGEFYRLANDQISPADVLSGLNAELLDCAGEAPPCGRFASALAGHIDFERGVLTYAAAGFDGALIFDVDGNHQHAAATGPLLAIEDRPDYLERTLRFDDGALLVAFTDGVSEARDRKRRSLLGSSGLAECVRRMLATVAGTNCRRLWQLIDFRTGGRYNDDATLLLATLNVVDDEVPRVPYPDK